MARRKFSMRRWRRRASEGMSSALVVATVGAGLGWLLDPRAGQARRAERLGRVARATIAALAARALLGRSLLRFPAAIAGAMLLGAPRRPDERASGAAGAGARRAHAQREAARAATRAREESGDRAAHVGGWHPEPEVVEVKSPAELEAGDEGASRREPDDTGP
jgi:hypothetical protein